MQTKTEQIFVNNLWIVLALASAAMGQTTRPTTQPGSFLGTWQQMRDELIALRAEVQKLKAENIVLKQKLQINLEASEPSDAVAAGREKFNNAVRSGQNPVLWMNFRVGMVGRLSADDSVTIIRIYNRSTMLVRYQGTRFLMKFIPTDGLADDQKIFPKEVFVVSGTERDGSNTLLVLEPINADN